MAISLIGGYMLVHRIINTSKTITCYKTKRLELLSKLSKGERQVLHYAVRGFGAKEISRIINLSSRTIEYYLSKVQQKLEMNMHQIKKLYWGIV